MWVNVKCTFDFYAGCDSVFSAIYQKLKEKTYICKLQAIDKTSFISEKIKETEQNFNTFGDGRFFVITALLQKQEKTEEEVNIIKSIYISLCVLNSAK